MRLRRPLYRIHIWLSWIVGLQILLWMVSGLFMVASPIETIRAAHLTREPQTVDLRAAELLPPAELLHREKRAVERLTLKTWLGRPAYELHYADGGAALIDARSGKRLSPLTATAASVAARAGYAGRAPVAEVTRVDPNAIPLDFRRDDPAWRIRFADREGTIFYVGAETGEVLARRTDHWRWFDLMWGLHIMDWRGRENVNNPLVIAASVLALLTTMAGATLLFMRRRRRATAG